MSTNHKSNGLCNQFAHRQVQEWFNRTNVIMGNGNVGENKNKQIFNYKLLLCKSDEPLVTNLPSTSYRGLANDDDGGANCLPL